MFAVFIFFLFITWGIGVGVMIFKLNHTLRKAQLSVKMIPATVLIQIKELEKGL